MVELLTRVFLYDKWKFLYFKERNIWLN
jgi:hypothetical protein